MKNLISVFGSSVLTAVVFSIAIPTVGQAAVFTVKDRTSDVKDSLPDLYNAVDGLVDDLEGTINTGVFSDSSRQTFLTAMAKANAGVPALQNFDAWSNPSKLVVGFSGGGAFNGSFGSTGANALPAFGVSAMPTVLAGVGLGWLGLKNLGPIDLSKLMVNANFGYLPLDLSDQISASCLAFGLGATYKLVGPYGNFLVGWGGVGLGFGFQYSQVKAGIKTTLNQQATTTLAGETVALKFDSVVDLGVKSTNVMFPIDLYTNATLLGMTLGFGMGLDLAFAGSTFTGGATGPVTASFTGGVADGVNLYSATGDLALEDGTKGSASVLMPRINGAYQVNLWLLRLFAQGGYRFDKTVFASAGLRFSL